MMSPKPLVAISIHWLPFFTNVNFPDNGLQKYVHSSQATNYTVGKQWYRTMVAVGTNVIVSDVFVYYINKSIIS